MKKLKSTPLKPGSTIGIIAPGSPVDDPLLIKSAQMYLEERNFQTVLGETATDGKGYLSGSDWVRQKDLENMWSNDNVNAIWCLRGGYGTLRLLNRLYYGIFEKKPKILMGFSDITALELGLWAQIKLVTFHGPVLTTLSSEFSTSQAIRMLTGKTDSVFSWPESPKLNYVPFKEGRTTGIILGGNLTTLVSMIGSSYFPALDDVILFIEEVKEASYRIDRLLTQLIFSGALDSVAAVVVGECVPVAEETEMDMINVFAERLHLLKCPSAYGFPIGHLDEQWTLPQGIMAEIDIREKSLVLLECPFNLQ